MLVSRLARLAGRHGLVLPAVLDSIRLGLIGTVKVLRPIPLLLTRRAEDRLSELGYTGNDLPYLLQCGTTQSCVHADQRSGKRDIPLDEIVRREALPEGVSLVVCSSRIQVRLLPIESGFLVVDAFASRGLSGAVILLGKFEVGTEPSFQAADLIRVVAREQLIRKSTRAELQRDENADRALMLPYRRYLENVREYVHKTPPKARYEIVSRTPLQLATDGDWPRLFTLADTPVTFMKEDTTLRSYMVAGLSEDGDLLVLDEDDESESLPAKGTLTIPPQLGPVARMLDALHAIAEVEHEPYLRLLEALREPYGLPEFAVANFEQIELGPRNPDNERQHDAVAMALACPDLCLIHGPPGTGKTKVICELVMQLARKGQRVLLVAPTHVALDNVLERIGDKPGVVAVRLGATDNVDDRARKYLIHNRSRSLSEELAERLRKALLHAPSDDAVIAVQRDWLEQIESTPECIGEALILNANLICATPIGIAMSREFRQPEPIFDVMIMDESSKATLTDFLVPASRAKRWILVGDHMQLAPYADQAELAAIVSVRAERNGIELLDDQRASIAQALTWHFDQRLHPDTVMRQKAWEQLLRSVFGEEYPEALAEIEPTQEAWRLWSKANEDGEHGARGRLMAELFEVQQVSMPSVFERLLRLPSSRIVRLNRQYRMLPQLVTFSRDAVYEGDYLSAQARRGQPSLAIPTLDEPSIWIDTESMPAQKRYEYPRNQDWGGGHYYNPFEVNLAVEVVERAISWASESWHEVEESSREPRPFELGIISFYVEQAKELKAAIFASAAEPDGGRWRRRARRRAANGAPIDLHVSIVDRFQGQEKDLIVISAARSNPVGRRGHVNNLNRLNVAVTRGRCKRIIIGDASTLAKRGQYPRDPSDLLARLFAECTVKQLWGRAFRSGGGR